MRSVSRMWLLLATLALGACSRTSPDEDGLNGPDLVDASAYDGPTHDGSGGDGGHPDGVASDAAVDPAEAASTRGPENCKSCCSPDGKCLPNDERTCGAGGVLCYLCPDGYFCAKNPLCVLKTPLAHCGPDNCDGCCWQANPGGICVSGTNAFQCGSHGEACATCDTKHGASCAGDPNGIGGSCQGGPPPPCTPNNCLGCCFGLVCATGTQAVACGVGGTACVNCYASSLKCSGGTCGK